MDITVIICTYNRAESLRLTLETLSKLCIPQGLTWELLVVDNHSTDRTKIVCEKFLTRLPLRYLYQGKQGKSYALNMSIEKALGGLLIFTDDDVSLPPDWIENWLHAQSQYHNGDFFVGRILPIWDHEPPNWIKANLKSLLRCPFVYLDHGSEPRTIRSGAGANLACRRSLFSKGLRFCTDVSPGSGEAIRGEDSDLLGRATDLGYQGLYWPKAVVHHRTSRERMTHSYIWSWFVGAGRAEVRLREIPQIGVFYGVPRYYWKQLVLNTVKYGLTRWNCPSYVWLSAEIAIAHAWGVISESRRMVHANR